MVVIIPFSMPTSSFITLAIGARQLVVHEPFEMTTCSLLSSCVVDAVDDGQVGAFAGGRDDHLLGAGGEVGRGLLLAT